jgi:hypothetical protein
MKRSSMPPPFIAAAILCVALACAALGYLGISERQLTTGSRIGIHSAYGLSAVVEGWLFIAGALACGGIFASRSRFKRLVWAALALTWIAGFAIYFVWFY